jgi:hypothetical protein
MKFGWKLLLAASLGAFLVWLYRRYHSILNYTTPSGQWVIKWNTPTGTQPISYVYTIVDTSTNTDIVSSTTTETSVVLDPSLFVPHQGGVMSDVLYTATITPTNAQGEGPVDTFSFNVYDQPNLVTIVNPVQCNSYTPIYPVQTGGCNIFGVGKTYNTLCNYMQLQLLDRVSPSNLSVTMQHNGTTYKPISITPQTPNSKGEAANWSLTWNNCNNNGTCTPQITFNTGDQVTFSVTASNPGGSFNWSNVYTVPSPPATSPGNIGANTVFVSS